MSSYDPLGLRPIEGFSRLLSEGFFEGALQWVLDGGRILRKVLRSGSKKGLLRRHLEGRNTSFEEYDPFRVRPKNLLCSQEENPPPPRKNPPKIKSSSERVFLNNFRWVPDSCHRNAGKSSRKLFEKVRVNAVFLWYFGIWGGFFGLYSWPPNFAGLNCW